MIRMIRTVFVTEATRQTGTENPEISREINDDIANTAT
jgi:hypothetical protein